MEEKHVQTLDALSEFIQAQKALLERTRQDIEKLRELRKEAVEHPQDDLEGLSAKLDDPSFKLSEQADCVAPPLPKEIDWAVFERADPTPFRTIAATARERYASRNDPPKTTLYGLSDLQKLVRDARATLIEPAIAAIQWPSEDEDDEPVDPEELRRAREREKIKELKKRRIEGGASGRLYAGLGLRKPVAGVFIRQDQEDESAEVDISMDGEQGRGQSASTEVATVARDFAMPASPETAQKPGKERQPSRKQGAPSIRTAKPTTAPSKAKSNGKAKAQAKPVPKVEDAMDVDGEEADVPSAPVGKDGKARSETYKQAWSVSEQHLLERLLEEIPEGEKNRWSKISKAMDGRRTARQVASRVQKYYEKLKRFGVEVGGSKS